MDKRDVTSAGRPRFLCDEMLGRLARYLRAAGYDTILAAGGAPDGDWLRLAVEEGRHLLTCDRLAAHHRGAAGIVCVLRPGRLDELAAQLSGRFGLDWLAAPFTRCLVDNTPLVATEARYHPELPADLAGRVLRRCPRCGRKYWFGAHCRRMRLKLEAWQHGAP